jgi:4-hydroxybenzoate polyprenyltransferase
MIRTPSQHWIGTAWKLSRPRFWLYLAGPYLVGYTAFAQGTRDFLDPRFLYSLFFFLIPANIILYGVNDLFDEDTDALNPKKNDKETRVSAGTRSFYIRLIGGAAVCSLPLLIYLPLFAKIVFLVFLALSIGYSAPPIRFKAKPYLDSASNILYAFPGFVAVFQLTSTGLSVPAVLAVFLWTAAMHLFSAIPDIAADRTAGIRTTATVIGKANGLLVCAILWTLAAISAIGVAWYLGFLLIYAIIPALLLRNPRADIAKVYWVFPYLNAATGFILFLVALFR